MNMTQKLLKISSIINVFLGLIIIPHITVLGAIYLVMGILLLSYSLLSIEELENKKGAIILMIIISFIFNILIAALLIIVLEQINNTKQINNNSPPEIISSESKRIDLLLKLGLGMIITSGILFATTSWDIISNITKVIILLLMGCMFLGLSEYSDKKLKIKNTTVAYYLLGLSFFLLTWIGIGYFGVVSKWFSYSGEGNHLVYFITFIIVSFLSHLINKKFDKNEFAYISILSIYLSVYHILIFIGLTITQTIIILSIISLGINIFLKDKTNIALKDINYLISYLYWILIISNCFNENKIVVLIASFINIVNILYLSIKNTDAIDNIFGMIICHILILTSILKFNINSTSGLIILIAITALSLVVRFNKLTQDKILVLSNRIIYTMISGIILIILSINNPVKLLVGTIIYFITSIINGIDWHKNNNNKFDYITQPLAITILLYGIIEFTNHKIIDISVLTYFSILSLAFCIMNYLIKEQTLKKIYFVISTVVAALTMMSNYSTGDILPSILLIIISSYLFYAQKDMPPSSYLKSATYIFVLLNIYITFYITNILDLPSLITSLLVLLIYGVIIFILTDKKLKTITSIALVLPMYNFIDSITMAEIIKQILFSIFQIYILYLIIKLGVKRQYNKDLAYTIGMTLIILQVIFIEELIIGLYVGILGLSIILLNLNKKEYKKLFNAGIIITVLNIIIQLWDYWEQIPFWLYLLLVGIFLVIFVTYKETKKTKEPVIKQEEQEMVPPQIKTEEQKEQEDINKVENSTSTYEEIIKFCPHCGARKIDNGNFCGKCGQRIINNINQEIDIL